MKPGRIIFLIIFVGVLSFAYWRSMQPVVRYDVFTDVPASIGTDIAGGGKGYAAAATNNELQAAAWDANAFVKIQGVYWSPRDGELEIAVFARELDIGEGAGFSGITIKLPQKNWPDEVVFRDITGNILARRHVVRGNLQP